MPINKDDVERILGLQRSAYELPLRWLQATSFSGRKPSNSKDNIRETARELRMIAHEELALENNLLPGRERLKALANDEKLRDAVTLWTYFHELNRRANFSSQGEAVAYIWRTMNPNERKKMNAEKILKARERLVTSLESIK